MSAVRNDPRPCTLFVWHIIPHATDDVVREIFSQFSGFQSSRVVKDRKGDLVAFVQYNSRDHGSHVIQQMNGRSDSVLSHNGRPISVAISRKVARSEEPHAGFVNNYNPAVNAYGAHALGLQQRLGALGTGVLTHNNVAALQAASAVSSFTLPSNASTSLFVEGVPLDATEREIAHIFRPFSGFLGVRLVPYETNGRNVLLCFVAMDTCYNAHLTMTQLQGYKIDRNDTQGIRISFGRERSLRNNNNKGNVDSIKNMLDECERGEEDYFTEENHTIRR